MLCNGEPVYLPLLEENDFLPDFSVIPAEQLERAKILYLNYPNNPTGAVAPAKFLREAVEFADERDIIIVYDNPYSEFTFGDYRAPSILEFSENHVEINSLSKMFCSTGHRCGWVTGNAAVIEGLKNVKAQIDSGCPMYIQRAAVKALDLYSGPDKPPVVQAFMTEYERRMAALVRGLNEIGWPSQMPKATFYLWQKLPEGVTNSMDLVIQLIQEGVVITPGTGFGEQYGEGFVRFAVTQPLERITEALTRIAKVLHA
jgi:LL-diaminopimelate aminotransferase